VTVSELISAISNFLFHHESKKVIKYLIVGAFNTVAAYLLFFVLVTFHVHYQLSLFIVTLLVIINSYLWNKHWTFRSSDTPVFWEFIRFNGIYLSTFTLNAFLLHVFVEKVFWDPRLAQVFCMMITTVINFLGHRFFSFKEV